MTFSVFLLCSTFPLFFFVHGLKPQEAPFAREECRLPSFTPGGLVCYVKLSFKRSFNYFWVLVKMEITETSGDVHQSLTTEVYSSSKLLCKAFILATETNRIWT